MKTILDLLGELHRDDVTELAFVTGSLPCVKAHGKFTPVDRVAPTSLQIRQWLHELGGQAYVNSLAAKPVQWQTRVDGVGRVSVVACVRGDMVQVRVARVRGRASLPPRRSLRPPKSMRAGPTDLDASELLFGSSSRKVEVQSPPAGPSIGKPAAIGTPRTAEIQPAAPRLGAMEAPAITSSPAAPSTTAAAASGTATQAGPTGVEQSLAHLLLDAQQKRASDVHVVAGRPVLLRVASELLPQGAPIGEADAQ
ncbi:MAG: hypothetical protein MUF54_22770, partial [Polyangiaceae bacterium]|nr:hypothetical protein [Polyangiaceae bacterium]